MESDIDLETLNGIRRIMASRFSDLIDKYLKSTHEYIEEAKKAAASRDANGIVEAVHPLKSSSASLGLVKMAALARNTETMAKDENPDWAAIAAGIEALGEAFLPVPDILNRAAGGA